MGVHIVGLKMKPEDLVTIGMDSMLEKIQLQKTEAQAKFLEAEQAVLKHVKVCFTPHLDSVQSGNVGAVQARPTTFSKMKFVDWVVCSILASVIQVAGELGVFTRSGTSQIGS